MTRSHAPPIASPTATATAAGPLTGARQASSHRCRPRAAAFAGLVLLAGCQTLTTPRWPAWAGGRSDAIADEADGGDSQPLFSPASARQAAAEADNDGTQAEKPTLLESTQQSAETLTDLISGREPENQSRARELYLEGDALFRRAQGLPREESVAVFEDAAKQFRKASQAAPDSALGQDALFMQAESEFFSDRLTDAAESYQKLQKDYPRNRHSDRAAARLFSISRYWIETDKADQNWLPNLLDPKRPSLDVDGHAVRVLDQIRFDDPTGRLADDATMAAAAEFIRQRDFMRADEFLTDLRETYSDSQHLFLAHLLGIRCKLEQYAGPKYSNLLLDEAEKLVEQTRSRFPAKVQEPKYAEILARASAEIAYKKAEKLFHRADYRDKRREYRAASTYYQRLLDNYPETPFAESARERLEEISERPAVPERRLSFLTKIFRDGRQSEPLELNLPDSDASSGSMLR